MREGDYLTQSRKDQKKKLRHLHLLPSPSEPARVQGRGAGGEGLCIDSSLPDFRFIERGLHIPKASFRLAS